MPDRGSAQEIPVVKDISSEGPIPSVWRPVFQDIVKAFVRGDFKLNRGIPGVLPVTDDMAEHMETYVKDYGETLVDLPEETWKSSVCIWMEDRWEALVDLWTSGEGRSDLVLHVFVTESASGFNFDIHMVYVP